MRLRSVPHPRRRLRGRATRGFPGRAASTSNRSGARGRSCEAGPLQSIPAIGECQTAPPLSHRSGISIDPRKPGLEPDRRSQRTWARSRECLPRSQSGCWRKGPSQRGPFGRRINGFEHSTCHNLNGRDCKEPSVTGSGKTGIIPKRERKILRDSNAGPAK